MHLGDPLDVPAGVRCAWHRLVASHGRSSIASIVQEVGWSQRHFIAQFKHEIGVSLRVPQILTVPLPEILAALS